MRCHKAAAARGNIGQRLGTVPRYYVRHGMLLCDPVLSPQGCLSFFFLFSRAGCKVHVTFEPLFRTRGRRFPDGEKAGPNRLGDEDKSCTISTGEELDKKYRISYPR